MWIRQVFVNGLLVFWGVFFSVPPLLLATENEDRFTLERALTTAMQRNLDLLGAKEALKGSESAADAVWREMLPSVSVDGSRVDTFRSQKNPRPRESYTVGLTVTQPIYRGRALWAGWKKADLRRHHTLYALQRTEQTLVRDVQSAWYKLLETRMLADLSKKAVARLKQHRDNVRHFFKEGRVWRNDLLQASVKVARGEQDLIVAENQLALAQSRMNLLLHRPITALFLAEGSLTWDVSNKPELEVAIQQAQQFRPEQKQADIEMTISRHAETEATSELHPGITLETNWTATIGSLDGREHDTVGKATVSINWDIWSWGSTLKSMEVAKSATSQARFAQKAQRDHIAREVQDAWLTVRESEKRVQVLGQAIQQAEEHYRVSQIRYQEQLGTANDLLDAQALFTETRSDYITAMRQYRVALVELDYAMGVTGR